MDLDLDSAFPRGGKQHLAFIMPPFLGDHAPKIETNIINFMVNSLSGSFSPAVWRERRTLALLLK